MSSFWRPKYVVVEGSRGVSGYPKYHSGRGSFSFERRVDLRGKLASVGVDGLEIMFELEGLCVCFVEGGLALQTCRVARFSKPVNLEGRHLRLSFREDESPDLWAGVSLVGPPLPGGAWFNPDSGWFCRGDPKPGADCVTIDVATDTGLTLRGGVLRSIWIRPRNWKDLSAVGAAAPPTGEPAPSLDRTRRGRKRKAEGAGRGTPRKIPVKELMDSIRRKLESGGRDDLEDAFFWAMVVVERVKFGASAAFADRYDLGPLKRRDISLLEDCLLRACADSPDLGIRSGCVFVLGRLRDSKFKDLFVRTLEECVEAGDSSALFQVMTALADIGERVFTRSGVSVVETEDNLADALLYLAKRKKAFKTGRNGAPG